jgi:hypothetical protein
LGRGDSIDEVVWLIINKKTFSLEIHFEGINLLKETLFLQHMNRQILLIVLFISLVGQRLWGQNSNATLFGIVSDKNGNPVEMVNVALKDYPFGTTTNNKGEYLLRIPTARDIVVGYSSLGYQMEEVSFYLTDDERVEQNIILQPRNEELGEVLVSDRFQSSGNIVRINPRTVSALPDVGIGSVEGVLKTLPGVTSSNELSSQYSVRGGNFDENLVYVNDIEVYRPYLVRSGQQEGLSFVNSDMVSSIEFSAGGFDAKYGDKMSSVLDIKYHQPTEFSASAMASLLGGKAHVEDISKDGKFTYNMGIRYKTFSYLLSTLEEKGSYNPTFLDYQGFFTYSPNDKLELGFLGTASLNNYQYIPESRKTTTGVWNDQVSLYIYYEGQEVDSYKTYTGAFYLNYKPSRNAYLKFLASAFNTSEKESFDIIGYYLLNEVEDEGTSEQNDTSLTIGVGYYQEHGRNTFDANVFSLSHKGGIKKDNHFLQWGANFKMEYVTDIMKEWEYRDSSGYSLPYSSTNVTLYYSGQTNYDHVEQRYTGFVQDSYSLLLDIGELNINGGIRAHYWSFTDKLSISPRISASLNTGIDHDIITRLSVGVYQQPPFYREIKNLYGVVNPDVQTPRSIHAVAGIDYSFTGWGRPFRLTAETYYKFLKDLIPYQIENVRVRYLADEISNGYACGLDLKINGEFVSGTQSWVSMSLMKTEEDLEDDGHGYIPRPTDQRFKFSMYFQDYLPGLPAYQMHLTGHFITGAPFGMPKSERYTQTSRIESYRRVDIGFVRSFVSNGKNLTKIDFFDKFKECDLSLEVFNMMDLDNISSYFFVADYDNNYYAIPNYLTGITFNLKLSATF